MSGEKRRLELRTPEVGGESPMKTPKQRTGWNEAMPAKTTEDKTDER